MEQEKPYYPQQPIPPGEGDGMMQQPPGAYNVGYGTPPMYMAPTPLAKPPPDHLVWSILMIFCCWPLSIPAIIKSCESRDASRAGDLPRAQHASQNAKCWNIAALVTGLILNLAWIAYVIFWAVFFTSAASAAHNSQFRFN